MRNIYTLLPLLASMFRWFCLLILSRKSLHPIKPDSRCYVHGPDRFVPVHRLWSRTRPVFGWTVRDVFMGFLNCMSVSFCNPHCYWNKDRVNRSMRFILCNMYLCIHVSSSVEHVIDGSFIDSLSQYFFFVCVNNRIKVLPGDFTRVIMFIVE